MISGASTTLVADGAHLRVDGAYTGSAIGDTMTVAGTMDGGGAIALAALASMLIYIVMAGVLVWRPTGLFGQRS